MTNGRMVAAEPKGSGCVAHMERAPPIPAGPRVEAYFRRKRSAKRARRGTNIGRSRRVS
ncbi:hypothetical protein FEP39_04114 [Burkholderia multivorans]|nr:hypothetical protein NP80_5059 [Burkholderia multivorans ATCC BAA-247]MDR8748790.1 hypothetical protein [Burkholderia multivorans]MDR8761902.1 hypothetical protein [Burkholderia multivorans]MDR8767833.1 hypothetical protein [Burkholderia multivorans]MDR8774686.1 hypothetical protein [Burkholderia multivorans]